MELLKRNRLPQREDKQGIIDLMKIFNFLLDGKDGGNNFTSLGIAPSIYAQQMLLTTEERTADLMKRDHGKKLHPEGVSFRATPGIIVFQRFSSGNNYSVTLAVKNITATPRDLKLISKENTWFKFECKDATRNRKIAPGMNVLFNVIFSPEENRDYKYQAVFSAGGETFDVPIIAIGPRALLDLPDSLEIPKTAVKILSVKQFLVRNIGDVSAVFSLTTKSPFTVYPQKGILEKGKTVQMTVNFLSQKTGFFKENLLVTYETGEIIRLNLSGSAEPGVIKIDEEIVNMEDTYLGLTRSKSFSIRNDSHYVSNFQWVLYESSERDELEKETYKRSFEMMTNIEAVQTADLEHYDICSPPIHELACQRIFKDELSSLKDQSILYRHPNYKLIPMKGEIWPHSAVDATIIFSPDETGFISSTAYLEVTGCEKRIPLSLRGRCVGPSIKLNITCADLGSIFLCSSHNYEVICGNIGDITGTLMYNAKPAKFGGKINVTPEQVKLKPGDYDSFNLNFSSNRIGDFDETVDFVVKESLEVISLLIKGSVISPKLHFDKPNLDFAVTALGFTTRKEICLHNSSLVPVTFGLTITQDGIHPAVTHQDFSRSVMKPSLVSNPREFEIIPSEGVVAPHSIQRIKISFTPNIARTSQTFLRADMWDSNSEPVMLPITFSSKVASLIVRPSEIVIRFCFINFPYMRSIIVENRSDVEGFFYFTPQSVMAIPTVIYSLSSCQGYLKPNESKSITLKIITTALGLQKVQLSLLSIGERSLTSCCTIICNGQGPIVNVQPSLLNWGEVQLLEQVQSEITLVSDSPIPAQFVARIHSKVSPWTVHPTSGSLEPNKSLELTITIYLRDAGKYSDKVDIEITNGRMITCALTAVGIGTSIQFSPSMLPVFDMGFLFRNQDISIPITMVNKGTRHHRLTWTTNTEYPVQTTSGTTERTPDKFTVDPPTTELPPGAESVIHCKIRWKVNEILTEQWYLYGQIKGQGKREVLGGSTFKATFKDPNISFSKRKLTFSYYPSGSELETELIDSLFLTNYSQIDLTASVSVDPPFELLAGEEDDEFGNVKTIVLPNDVSIRICVRFNTSSIETTNLYSRMYRGVLIFHYTTHCEKDKIDCVAEVNYPNISLSPKERVTLSCEVGLTACKSLKLINAGHLPVNYNFEWLYVNAVESSTEAKKIPCQKVLGIQEDEEEEAADVRNTADFIKNHADNECVEVSSRERMTAAGKIAVQKSLSGCTFMTIAEDNGGSNGSVKVDAEEIRDSLIQMTEKYLHEDAEISSLKDFLQASTTVLDNCKEPITEILDLVPKEGSLLPHSSQYVYFELDASQGKRIDVDAKLACHVEGGPTETISLKALADTISYFVDKKCIDFGLKLVGELCRETLTVANRGIIEIIFETKVLSKEISGQMQQLERTEDVDPLTVNPECGTVDPMTETCLEITYCPSIPGPFNREFDLEIAHRLPLTIQVRGCGTLPQVYLTIPRFEAFKKLPVEKCYQAIGHLSADFLIQAQKFSHKSKTVITTEENDESRYNRITESEEERLTANGWELVPDADSLPTVTDIEMAIERLLMTEDILRNSRVVADYGLALEKKGMPPLLVPEYVIDMGHVVVGRLTCYSTMLVNYGPTPVNVRVKKSRSKNGSQNNFGISVQFRDRKNLPVGESTSLNVSFNPSPSVYTENRSDIEHAIYLEVTDGATIPISVLAVATYPFLTAHTTHLAFEDIPVGNCMLMPIRLRNDGWVECEWEATIRCEGNCRSKEEIGPFFLHYNVDTLLPGYESLVNVYFKPKEAKFSAAQLRIKVEHSIHPVLVSMTGRGIEPDLQVLGETLTFDTVLPYVRSEPKIFLLKNVGTYPVEVFWRDLDQTFLEEERVIRILMRYYGVDEILFPPRHPGDKLSARLYDFYQNLTEEMIEALAVYRTESDLRGSTTPVGSQDVNLREDEDRGREQIINEVVDEDESEELEVGKTRNPSGSMHQLFEKMESSTSEYMNKSIDRRREINSSRYDQIIRKFSKVPDQDPDRIEALLNCYIDELREKEDFSETMKDPVKEVFDDAEMKLPLIDLSSLKSRSCIIFHGAPFTGYRQAAYKVGKKIGVSVLNIDNAIIEIIALGNSVCSIELQNIVDKNYADLYSRWETHRNEKLSKNEDNRIPSPQELPAGSEAIEELNKIPGSDELESMNALDSYELKIQSILLLTKIMSSSETRERRPRGDPANDKSSEKTSSKGKKKPETESTFLGISLDLFHEALEQRLSMPDFELGFTVETLDNIFIKNERETLVTLLNILGNVKNLLFVTFYNNWKKFLNHNEKLVADEETKAAEELEEKLIAIEEMTWNEYENISEDDKLFYASKTYDSKRADSLRRRSTYNLKLAKAILNRNTPPMTKRGSAAATNYGAKTSRSRRTESGRMKSLTAISNGAEHVKPKRSTGTNSGKISGGIDDQNVTKKIHPSPKGTDDVFKLMETYQISLSNLQPVFANWDPVESTYITETPLKNKPPKSTRVSGTVQKIDESKGIDVLYVSPGDPWKTEIYDGVVSYLVERTDVQNLRPTDDESKMSLDSKLYSVVRQKPISPSFGSVATPSGVYTLTSIPGESRTDPPADPEGSSSHGLSEELPKSRWIMQPDEVCKFKVYFNPNRVGIHKGKYPLSVVGSNVIRCIEIEGIADVPRLNMEPEVIFSTVKESKVNDLNKPAYFLDTKTYDFGSIPLTKSEENRVQHTREAKFFFFNPSTISVAVAFHRLDNSDAYSVSPDSIEIAPGKSDIVNVTSRVSKVGPNSERLLLCIKNNPQVEIIQLQTFGSKVEIELEGKDISFGKILLRRRARRSIVVRNKSNIPLCWRLNSADEDVTDSQVTLHPEQGCVKPLATCNIECSFLAKLVGRVEKKIITFQAYLREHDVEPIFTDSITVAGETYDVKVDLTNASPIDFKRVNVGTLATKTFAMENRGQYDVGFIVQPESLEVLSRWNINCPPTLVDDSTIEPANGSLSPGEPILVSVNLMPRDELTLVEAPLFKCLLIDAHQTPTVVAEFPILVSVSARYTKLKIEPSCGLNFGPIAIFNTKTMHLNIENTGCFSFQYKINGPPVIQPPSDNPSSHHQNLHTKDIERGDKSERLASRRTGSKTYSKKDDRTPHTAKATRSGGDQKAPALRVGPFSLSRDQGSVEAGEVDIIAVDCCPDSAAIFEEEIIVSVRNIKPNKKNGLPVKLFANGCMPTIDLRNTDAIFQENCIVDSIEEFRCSRELGSHSIYGRKEECLYFRRVTVSNSYSTRVRLDNQGLVPCDVTAKVHKQSDSGEGDRNAGVFAVEPQKLRISATSTGIFTVWFSPTLSGSYSAVLDIVLELPPPLKSQRIGVKLCGEGAVPEVILLEPTAARTDDQIIVNFGRRPIDDVGYRTLSLKNIGSVEARVIVEISEDANGLFAFEAVDEDVKGINEAFVGDKRRVVCCMIPEDVATLTLKFAPSEVGKYKGRVDIYVVNNPHEELAMIILGESYSADVIIEGLALTDNIIARSFTGKRSSRSRKGSRDSQLKTPLAGSTELINSVTAYKLDYGSCFLNESKAISFKMVNKSKENSFRFEFASHPNVVFSPSIGHLSVLETRTVVATFSALVPTVHTETPLECTINEITVSDGESNEINWDERLSGARWDTGESGYLPEKGDVDPGTLLSTKVVKPVPGLPVQSVVPGSTRIIRVALVATAAYSLYNCPLTEINFKDTLMFQKCKYTFVLSNPGIVDLWYKWNLHMGVRCPTRLSNSTLWEVFKSLDNAEGSRSRSKSRSLSGTICETQVKEDPAADSPNLFTSGVISNQGVICSLLDGDYFPFDIKPEGGVLLPGESKECTLTFSPLDVSDYQAYLACRVENLDPALPPLNVRVAGRSLLPYCHFDLPESDYLSSEKRSVAVPGLSANEINAPPTDRIRVVEFQVLGVGETHVKKFCMINPTEEDYHFSWQQRAEGPSYFDCSAMEGIAEKGKKTEFTFTFFAPDVGTFESFWIFLIERYELEITFLFVATVKKPLVYFVPGHLQMKPTFIGTTARASITIFNGEDIPLQFRIIRKSLCSADRLEQLTVDPMFGILQPSSEEHFKIRYQPAAVGDAEFLIRCRIDKRKEPLIATVTAETYSIERSVIDPKENEEA